MLFRSPEEPSELEFAHYYRRWYQIGEFLKNLLEKSKKSKLDPVTDQLVAHFLEFMKGQNMTSETVGWELTQGIRAWRALHDMIYQALGNRGNVVPRASVGSDWGGWYTDSRATNVWIGVTWENPSLLQCETVKLRVESVPDEFGTKIDTPGDPGGQKWIAKLDLGSEEIHFFSRSLASQKVVIETFVGKCLEATAGLPTK